MPSPNEITPVQLSRLIGLPDAPRIIDARMPHVLAADARTLPAALPRRHDTVGDWAGDYAGHRVVVCCEDGGDVSQGVAAHLRHERIVAETLQGGIAAWRTAGMALLRTDRLPARDGRQRTVWVTRARPKVVRIACPWLIRRFIDPNAVFLFVAPAEVAAVAEQFHATPFDAGDGEWNDRDELCTFDVMVAEFGLRTPALARLALIVRGADTGRPDLTPQSAGLLAACLGYSRMHRDDVAQLDAALPLFDAFYRWCRDGTDETHG